MQTTDPPKLLIIDSERKFLQKITKYFQKRNITSHAATSASMAAAMLRGKPYPIVITDFFLPDETDNLLEVVRRHRPEALVIILTGYGTLDTAVAAIREGCFDYLRKPVKIDQLMEVINRATEQIEGSLKSYPQIVVETPPESYSRIPFQKKTQEEFYRASRYQANLSLVMTELDDSEGIHSIGGPERGNFLLKKVAPSIRKQLRNSDFIYPYGEDRLGIVLPKTSRMGAVEIARKLQRMFSEQEIQVDSQSIRISLSFGIASYPEDPILTDTQLIKFAEDALDTAKKNGKHQIGFYGLDIFSPSTLSAKVNRESAKLSKLVQSKHGLWRKLKKVYVESLDSLVNSSHAEEDYYKVHSANVSRYAQEIARMLELDNWLVEKIKYAGILHDIGKIGMPKEILLKPDRLTGEEFNKIKRHCEIGVQLVRDAHFLQEEIPIIMHHHEWFDGSGYPCGLKGEDIPLGARILGMVDTFDSLTQKRCYRKRYAPEEAMEEIKKYSGLQFDPELVNCMEKLFQQKEH